MLIRRCGRPVACWLSPLVGRRAGWSPMDDNRRMADPFDPVAALVSSLHAGPGTIALLVGSGISRSAEVPTGWEVAVDLLRRLAVAAGEDAEDDPVAWFAGRTGIDPDYSRILNELAPSAADRRNLLQQYFEPTQEERERGAKGPTAAHQAIAELVADRYIRVIVTTNFDRLLERALADAGVEASVVSSPAAAAGMIPLAHSRCTLIKVHGDYLSPDLKNTVEELGSYDPVLDGLLDQVFDQYGLVVCGWSAEWDTALRNAVLRAPGRRYASYWTHRGQLSGHAAAIVAHKAAIRNFHQLEPTSSSSTWLARWPLWPPPLISGRCPQSWRSTSSNDAWPTPFIGSGCTTWSWPDHAT